MQLLHIVHLLPGSSDHAYRDKAVRLDLVDPEALLQHAAGPIQQLFKLEQSEGSNLRDDKGQP